MEDDITGLTRFLQSLSRPRLLMQAAGSGLPDYRRERDLKRIASADLAPDHALALPISIEAGLEPPAAPAMPPTASPPVSRC